MPVVQSRVPVWDLAVVLEGLSLAIFEPIDEVSEKFLSFKVAFLLAITSLKRDVDLQALSAAPSSLEFAPGRVKAILQPRPGPRCHRMWHSLLSCRPFILHHCIN